MAHETTPAMREAIEDTFGIPRGSILKDPEAAAVLALAVARGDLINPKKPPRRANDRGHGNRR